MTLAICSLSLDLRVARSELTQKFLDNKHVRLPNVGLKAIERPVFDDQADREGRTEGGH